MKLSMTGGLHRALDRLLDERVGIVRLLVETPSDYGEPAFFHFAAETAPTDRWLPRRPFTLGGGASTTRDRAAAKAFGECIERYCAAVYRIEEFPLCSARAAEFDCVDPESFGLFSARQYGLGCMPYRRFDRDTPIRWTPATDGLGKGVVYVPAAMVYLPYYGERHDEQPIVPPVSTGLASGSTVWQARLGALMEVVERDAFCVTWYERRSCRRVDRTALPVDTADMWARFEVAGYRVELMDITTEIGIPVILAVALGERRDSPAVAVASAAAPLAWVAANKALEELAITLRYQRDLLLQRQADIGLAGDQHLRYWNDSSRREQAEFLWTSRDSIKLDDMGDLASAGEAPAVRAAVHRLAEHGLRTLFVDVTTEDVGDAGLVVVRALVPGLMPLWFGPDMVAEGSPRLNVKEINTLLHPFP